MTSTARIRSRFGLRPDQGEVPVDHRRPGRIVLDALRRTAVGLAQPLDDPAGAVQHLVVHFGLREGAGQVSGLGGDQREVLVHDVVAEALAQQPGLDLDIGRPGKPLHGVDATPCPHPPGQLEDRPVPVGLRAPQRGHRVERQIFQGSQQQQQLTVPLVTGQADEHQPGRDRVAAGAVLGQPATDRTYPCAVQVRRADLLAERTGDRECVVFRQQVVQALQGNDFRW
jgi:hypothetical protein